MKNKMEEKTRRQQAHAKGIHNPLQRLNALGSEAYPNKQLGSDTTCKDIEALEGVNRVVNLFMLNSKLSEILNLSLYEVYGFEAH